MPMTISELLGFVRQHTALSESDARSACEQAAQPDYWRSLATGLSIGSAPSADESAAAGADVDSALIDYREYGHCIVDGAFHAAEVERLRSGVMSVHDAGWPMVFAFLYDQFWTIARSPALTAFAHALLGPGYQPTISFWVNYVPPTRGGSGFPPHFDDVRPGHPSVTCWLPLTPSYPDNGCVYVVERDLETKSPPPGLVGTSMTMKQVQTALLHVRALPASPGSFLAWPHDTLHWGGMFLRGRPRLALSYHLTSADYENIDPDLRLSLVPGQPLPPFDRRLRWASRAMLRFRARDPLLERFTPVARQLAPLG